MKILIFGGSFDPIHNGHMEIVKLICENNFIDLVLFIPVKIPHWKNIYASPKHRFEMLQIATKSIKNSEIITYEIDQTHNDQSYTINTVEYIKTIYPNDELFLLVGADQLLSFDRWREHQKLLSLVQLIVVDRDELTITNLEQQFNAIHFNGIEEYISSTGIRNNLIESKKFLNIDVFKYIIENGLYHQFWLKNLMSEHRYTHSVRVAEYMQHIMKIHNHSLMKKAWLAGLYHDIAKDLDEQIIKKIANELAIKNHINVLHGPVGAHILETQLFFRDKEILNAISRHTLPFTFGVGPLTDLDKLLFCCDKLEAQRTNDEINEIDHFRLLLKQNLTRCFDELNISISKQYKGKEK